MIIENPYNFPIPDLPPGNKFPGYPRRLALRGAERRCTARDGSPAFQGRAEEGYPPSTHEVGKLLKFRS